MRRHLLGLIAVFAAIPSIAECQQVACLYNTFLVMRDRPWCVANGQALLEISDPSKISPADGVKSVQMLLVAAGHNPGPIDGIFGDKTYAALTEHQRRFGLSDDFDATLRSLKVQADHRAKAWLETQNATQAPPSQSSSPYQYSPPPTSPSPSTTDAARAASQVGGRVAVAAAEHGARSLKGAGSAVHGLVVLLVGGVLAVWFFVFRKR